jgi:hypothetical protein
MERSASRGVTAGALPKGPLRMSGLHTGVEIRPCTPADDAALLALHARGFGVHWPETLWHWRTTAVPGGRYRVMGAFLPNGQGVACFAGVLLPCRYAGEPGFAMSGSNSVLDPRLQRTLAGARIFENVVAAFFSTFCGGDVRMMYGSPVPSLIRVMVARIRVGVFAEVHALVHELQHRPEAPAGIRVERMTRLRAEVARLGERCALPTGLVRDPEFLDWRFLRHPTVRYELLAARGEHDELRGLAVLRPGGWRPDILSVADWLVPEGDADTERALLAHAVDRARATGAERLVSVFSANWPEHRRWQVEHRFFVHPTSHQLVFRGFRRGIDRAFLFDHWRLSMADLEFL